MSQNNESLTKEIFFQNWKIYLFCIVGTLLIFIFYNLERDQKKSNSIIGQISLQRGSVFIKYHRNRFFELININKDISNGDTLFIQNNSEVGVTLFNGEIIKGMANSIIEFGSSDKTTLKIISGKIKIQSKNSKITILDNSGKEARIDESGYYSSGNIYEDIPIKKYKEKQKIKLKSYKFTMFSNIPDVVDLHDTPSMTIKLNLQYEKKDQIINLKNFSPSKLTMENFVNNGADLVISETGQHALSISADKELYSKKYLVIRSPINKLFKNDNIYYTENVSELFDKLRNVDFQVDGKQIKYNDLVKITEGLEKCSSTTIAINRLDFDTNQIEKYVIHKKCNIVIGGNDVDIEASRLPYNFSTIINKQITEYSINNEHFTTRKDNNTHVLTINKIGRTCYVFEQNKYEFITSKQKLCINIIPKKLIAKTFIVQNLDENYKKFYFDTRKLGCVVTSVFNVENENDIFNEKNSVRIYKGKIPVANDLKYIKYICDDNESGLALLKKPISITEELK